MHTPLRIRGLGAHLPEKILTNQDLEKMVETSDEWIVTRTGIKRRRIAPEGTRSSDLAAQAAQKALAAAGLQAGELTHVLCATLTPDSFTPSTACVLALKLGIPGVPAMDVSAACSGFLYGLETARALVALHPQAKVLLACCEVLSTRVNWADRGTCVLFGDGAGAAVLCAPQEGLAGPQVLDILLASDASDAEALTIYGGGSAHPYKLGDTVGPEYFIQMQGREVYKWAVRSMADICTQLLARHGLTTADVDLFISHQANLRIIEAVGKKLNLPEERVFVNITEYGNTSAASVPIAMVEALESGAAKPGQLGLLAAFGGGFTWGAALVRF